MTFNLGCIVEGYGDVQAVPVLLRRVQQELHPDVYLNIPLPWRRPRYRLVKPGELEGTIEALARQLQRPRTILILVDADDDPPCRVGPDLLARATEARPDIPMGLVLAKHEYEAWLLAALPSLAGRSGLRDQLPDVADPEAKQDAKKVLSEHMEAGQTYKATRDQARLTALFDMQLARQRSDSFDKCWREVQRLLGTAAADA